MTKETVKLITDQAELAKEIKSLAGRAKKLDRDFQVAALSAISIFNVHGNVFYINAVYNALGKGARHVAMTAWLLAFGGVQANESEGKITKEQAYDLISNPQGPLFEQVRQKAEMNVAGSVLTSYFLGAGARGRDERAR